MPLFGLLESELSLIFRMGINHLFSEFGVMLQNLNSPWFAHQRQDCAAAVYRKGSPLANCVGFIDGTGRPVCRSTHNQRLVYNGHKRCLALKRGYIEFKYYADAIHSDLTPPGKQKLKYRRVYSHHNRRVYSYHTKL